MFPFPWLHLYLRSSMLARTPLCPKHTRHCVLMHQSTPWRKEIEHKRMHALGKPDGGGIPEDARAAVGTRAPAVLPHHADQTFTHMKGLLVVSIILLLRIDAGNSRKSVAFFNLALGARVNDHAPMSAVWDKNAAPQGRPS
jgi:hypothetical protein